MLSNVELVEGPMAHATIFFASVFEAREWRKPFADVPATTGHEAG